MKITALELYKVAPRWLFLKTVTDEGICGWGEPVIEGRADTVEAAVKELSTYLIGKDPFEIEDTFQTLYRGGFYRGGPVLSSAISGIEQTLWDIKGKALNLPVYELLGGKVRDQIQVYCWIGGDRPDDTAAAAKEKAAQGYRAVKMNGTAELDYIDSWSPAHPQRRRHRHQEPEALGQDARAGGTAHQQHQRQEHLAHRKHPLTETVETL